MKRNASMFYFLNFCLYFFIGPISAWPQPLEDLPIHQSGFVIYDNDDHRDVYTDEYLLSLNHLGAINLASIITTYAPNKQEYQLFIAGRRQIISPSALVDERCYND